MARAGAFGEEFAGRAASATSPGSAVGKVGRGEPYQSAVKREAKPPTASPTARSAMFTALIAAFDDEATPYLSRARPMMERARYLGDYDHLARVREWALVESDGGSGCERRRAVAVDAATAAGAGRRLEPGALGLGVGQCRLGQDLRARRAASSACCSPAPIPARILCLTFTKAAAAEMAKRVFADLRRVDDALRRRARRAIAEIEGGEPGRRRCSPRRAGSSPARSTRRAG